LVKAIRPAFAAELRVQLLDCPGEVSEAIIGTVVTINLTIHNKGSADSRLVNVTILYDQSNIFINSST
jgi:hypothetical protein